MNIVIYVRVSSKDQAEKYGLDAQRNALRALAYRRGHTVVEEVVDGDEGRWISGTVVDRPGIARARELLRSGAVERVLALDMSRLARETKLGLTIIEDFEGLGTAEF